MRTVGHVEKKTAEVALRLRFGQTLKQCKAHMCVATDFDETVSVGSSSLNAGTLVEAAPTADAAKAPSMPALLIVAAHPYAEDLVRKALALMWSLDGVDAACVSVGDIYDVIKRACGTTEGADGFCAHLLRRRVDAPARQQAAQKALRCNIAVIIGAQSEAVLSQLPADALRVTISMDHTLPMAFDAYISPRSTPTAAAYMLQPHVKALLRVPA